MAKKKAQEAKAEPPKIPVMAARSREEIDAVRDEAAEVLDSKRVSRWPGMTYEEGVYQALRWVMGETENNPMEDD